MTKLNLIARTALNILGVFFIVCWLGSLRLIFESFISAAFTSTNPYVITVTFLVIHVLVLFLLYYIFIRKGASLPGIGANNGEGQERLGHLWIQAGLRLGFVFCGVMILIYNYSFIEDAVFFLITAPRKIVDMIVMGYIDPMFKRPAGIYISNIINLIRVIFGVYLLLGAPHFVNWQTKKLMDDSVPDKIPDTAES